MDNILIIKVGALGDVVRTTPLLHILKGRITWVTHSSALPLLSNIKTIDKLVDIQDAHSTLKGTNYRLILSLEEDLVACRLATELHKEELIGAYEKDGTAHYTDSAAEWFDMGLISRFGRAEADKRKWLNQKTYQEILFSTLGKKFNNEEYVLPSHLMKKPKKKRKKKQSLIGLESRSGERWIGKRWTRFPEFINLLEEKKIPYLKFHDFPTLEEFIRTIDQTDLVVTTDSLSLHLALALRKKVISLFTCTSFTEIHGYNRMKKIISPQIEKYFYQKDVEMKSGGFIEPELVLNEMHLLDN